MAEDSHFREPEWVAAQARLLTLLPNASRRIATPYNMTPDPIWEAASEAGALAESVLLPYSWRSTPATQGTKDWDDYETLELFDVVFHKHPPVRGPVWLITDRAFFDRLPPYSVQGEQLREFVAAEQCDLHHDVLFIWQRSPQISVIHHEAAFFHVVVPDPGNAVVVAE